MKPEEAKAYIYLGGAVLAAYLVYKVAAKASDAAGAVGDAISGAASAANQGIATGVGAIGSVFGLPTPEETIDDPYVVRYIIDTEGQMEASKRGTALAYIKALTMPAGSGHPMQSALTAEQVKTISSGPMVMTPENSGDSVLSGPSFNSVKDNPWGWI